MGRRRWRHYRTENGTCPTLEFIHRQPQPVADDIFQAMKRAVQEGLSAARKVRGNIWEIRVEYKTNPYRLLFAPQAKQAHIFLALACFQKKTQKTPQSEIAIAEQRLADWLQRGRTLKTRAVKEMISEYNAKGEIDIDQEDSADPPHEQPRGRPPGKTQPIITVLFQRLCRWLVRRPVFSGYQMYILAVH